MAENGAHMSKYGLYPVMVLVFIATFVSLIYGFASNGYLYETSIPSKPSGTMAHHGEAADEYHGKTPSPDKTPAAVSSTATPAASATPATATPVSATPAEATPAATGTPAGMATPAMATPAGSPTSAPITAP
jgi:hypothetical protein